MIKDLNEFMKDVLLTIAAAVVIGICYWFLVAAVCELTGKLCIN